MAEELAENICEHIYILRRGHQPIVPRCYDCTGYNTHIETGRSLNCWAYTKAEAISE